MSAVIRDIDISIFIGGCVARGIDGNTAIATGRNLDDSGIDGNVAANKIWKSMASTYEGMVYETLKPGKDLTKKQIIEQLPDDLLKLTWSCRHSKHRTVYRTI